ncbi:SsrA-binding protein [Tenericutes bacterium MO-XQ]|jgi:SsrA-binding protein|nr:SsrA-binding protein [Tenericutes bacterium MO-XQ]
MKIISQNKKARHDYFIEETYEAGIKLMGSEIKSIRQGKVNLSDSYVTFKDGEAFILNMHISKYDYSNRYNHDETRTRKILLHKNEILKLFGKTREQGYAVIPLKVYLKDGLAKVEVGLAKGKKDYDKRQTLKEKDAQKRMDKILKHR